MGYALVLFSVCSRQHYITTYTPLQDKHFTMLMHCKNYSIHFDLPVQHGREMQVYWNILFVFRPFYFSYLMDRLKMWQFFSNEVSFIWLRPPTHPLQMKVWKTEYRCIINQTPPKNIGFRTMYSPYACHDKGSIYE